MSMAGIDPALAGANPDFLKAYALAQQNYGGVAWMLSVPELQEIVLKAAAEGWDDLRLQGALEQSSWWKSHNAAARQFEELRNTDEQQAETQLRQMTQTVIVQAATLGITIDGDRARKLAEHGLTLGWTQQDYAAAVADEFHYQPGQPLGGNAEQLSIQFRQMARDYGVNIPEEQIATWLQANLAGTMTPDTVRGILQQQSISKFPWLKDRILAGETPGQVYGDYQRLAATLLETPDADFGLDSPLLKQAISRVGPDGNPAPMSLWEFEMTVKKDPRYQQTKGAVNAAASLAEFLGQKFGEVAA